MKWSNWLIGGLLMLALLVARGDTTLVSLDAFGGQRAPTALLDTVRIAPGPLSFEDALNELILQGKLDLSFNRNRLPLSKMVNIPNQPGTALDFLNLIIAQASCDLLITSGGQLVIVPLPTLYKQDKELP